MEDKIYELFGKLNEQEKADVVRELLKSYGHDYGYSYFSFFLTSFLFDNVKENEKMVKRLTATLDYLIMTNSNKKLNKHNSLILLNSLKEIYPDGNINSASIAAKKVAKKVIEFEYKNLKEEEQNYLNLLKENYYESL